MSCPCFYPVEPRIHGSAMLPLGDAWTGLCRAAPDVPWQPDDVTLRACCNLGYARGTCARFPSAEGPDAARFTIADDNGSTVRIYYVLERDHHPFAHGPLEYSITAGTFVVQPADDNTARQAQAYVQSYLRRKMEAFGSGMASQ